MLPKLLAAMLLGVAICAQAAAPPAKPWQRVDGCRWKADRWNDGGSFHVITGDAAREIVARLYFVDTPEAETAYRDRLDELAGYFAITREQATEIAHEAAAFTEKRPAAPFTVWTRWRSALGRSALGRVYRVILTEDGRDLNELLVENGLARIYGTRTTLYDGRSKPTVTDGAGLSNPSSADSNASADRPSTHVAKSASITKLPSASLPMLPIARVLSPKFIFSTHQCPAKSRPELPGNRRALHHRPQRRDAQ